MADTPPENFPIVIGVPAGTRARGIILSVSLAIWMAVSSMGAARAAGISIPNASFESPATTFVAINIDEWQKGPKPDWFDETGGFRWNQLTGIFKNTPSTSQDHLDNCDGEQAIWIFAIPEVELFQDYNSVDWDDAVPAHGFDARFEAGKAYALTVGVNGGGGGMVVGATLRMSLYFRDGASNKVLVGMTFITNTAANFPTHTHLTDYQVRVPVVRPGDPCAGQNIGIQILSTVTTNSQGGYWDLDNVRLCAVREPALTAPRRSGGQFQFALESEPGLTFEILASGSVELPLSEWTSLGMLTNDTGTVTYVDTPLPVNRRFYRARQVSAAVNCP
ncbi:MAG: hypothetical protein QOF48_547 [Verrucomicrobiota bacterium]|jgi:hypothetical protein